MKIIRDITHIRQGFKRPVLTIGIFDGVHLAHQQIIKKVVHQAKMVNGTSMVLTFDPHPAKSLGRKSSTPMITSMEHRIDLIRRLKVDVCIPLHFTKEFSQLSAEEFVKRILVDDIGISYLVVGEGFRFGKQKSGSFAVLKRLAKIYGYKIKQIKTIKINGQTVSSSRTRSLIQRGKIEMTNRLLGRKFSIYGKVKRGNARGRIMGYPTANIEPRQEVVPAAGVYAVFVKLDSNIFPGILNIGVRPTFKLKQDYAHTIEVHIFDFHKEIYDKRLEVFFIQRIRSEKKFISQQNLIEQIKKDELIAKKILQSHKSFPPN